MGFPRDKGTECKAMFDGTWCKRGHSSVQGVVTAFSAQTGNCLDYEALNKICYGCACWSKQESNAAKDNWFASHRCAVHLQALLQPWRQKV